jgi:hypothetical protein
VIHNHRGEHGKRELLIGVCVVITEPAQGASWDTSRALRVGAVSGLAIGALTALDARGWVLGSASSFIMQMVVCGVVGALLFWLAAFVRNRLSRSD